MFQDKFLSSEGKTHVNYYIFECDNPKAVLQISHGMAEEGLCYKEFALFLNKQNYIVCVNDHLGHGDSQIEHKELLEFNEKDGYNYVIKDIKQLHDIVSAKYPNLPYFILGFSLGSFLFRRYLQIYPNSIDGAIIMGTGEKNTARISAFRAMRRLYDSPEKKKFKFKLLNKIRERREKRIENNFILMMADDKTKQKFANSWIRNYIILVGKFYNINKLFKLIKSKKNIKKMNKNMPILLISGDEDSVGNNGKAVQKLYDKYKSLNFNDVSLILYPGLRHVILMSKDKEKVMKDVVDWLDKHIQK